MTPGEILISVIIPTHNRADALKLTLARLAEQNFRKPWEAIVINNNSTDETDEVVKSAQADFPVSLSLIYEKNPGPAATRNKGARAARGEYLIFIDNDILTEPDFLQKHYERLRNNPNSWFVGQVIDLPEHQATVFGKYRKSLYPVISADTGLSETDAITGQGTSMPRAHFEMLGGFDENFFTASGEDRELAMRAMAAGIKIYFDPGIVTGHNDWAGTSIRDFCRRQRLYTQTEPFFWRKYGDKTPRLEMVKKNTPPDLKKDRLQLFVWKHAKKVLGSDAGQSAIIGLCEISERVLPAPAVLWRLYRLASAGAIFRGFQEGLSQHATHVHSKNLKTKNESAAG